MYQLFDQVIDLVVGDVGVFVWCGDEDCMFYVGFGGEVQQWFEFGFYLFQLFVFEIVVGQKLVLQCVVG